MHNTLKMLVSRLAPPVKAAFETAANRAFARSHHEVEVEHILWALLEGRVRDAIRALQGAGVDVARLETELNLILDRLRTGNVRNPVMSASIFKWLERAWLIASAQYGADRIDGAHLIEAIATDEAMRAIVVASLPSMAAMSIAGLQLVSAGASTTGRAVDSEAHGAAGASPALDRYTTDLTFLARAGQIDPVIGREAEIRQIADVLLRRRQNNPILTGEPGVGKTAVVEGLALKVANGDVPPALRDIALRTLDLGLLQAGASVKGEFESRLRQVIDEVKASLVPVVLFIDEAHTLVGAGGQAGQNDAANLLKPLLARGELRTIAATTWAEYKKYFEKDAALARRFQVVKVEEPAPDVAVPMVRAVAVPMASHHGVTILDEAVRATVHLSGRYLTGRQLPDKAVSVLDTACARVALSRAGRPAAIEDLEALRENLQGEQRALEREHGDAVRLAEIAARVQVLEAEILRLRDEWSVQQALVAEIDALAGGRDVAPTTADRAATLLARRAALRERHRVYPLAFECVDEALIADVISGWTGIPLGRMVGDEIGRVRRLGALLRARVIGQDEALDCIVERVQIAAAGLEDPGKPKGVFLLVGPSGVGKTETALALADALYGGERTLITINMSEYQEAHSVAGLKGSPPGYVGYGEGGVLTEAVRRRPYSVVLLDEVEKAHPDVLELFFQVFDKGRLEDSEGRVVDFRNTIILLTSNTGSDLVMRAVEHGVRIAPDEASRAPSTGELIELLRPTLQATFKPAFLGRLSIVPYRPLDDDVLRRIVALKLDRIRERIHDNHGAQVLFAPELTEHVAARCSDVDSGARDADGILTRSVLTAISSRLLQRMADGKPVRKVAVSVREGAVQVRLN